MSSQTSRRASNQDIMSSRQKQDRANQKYPDYFIWSNENTKGAISSQIPNNFNHNPETPKKEGVKKITGQRSQSQKNCRPSQVKENQQSNNQFQSPRHHLSSALSMRSPQSQISTHYQSSASNIKSSSVQRTPYFEKLEKEYQRKNYDNVKKYLDLAKINRRVTANDVKKLAANPLSGINTNIKGALTMEGVHKRIIRQGFQHMINKLKFIPLQNNRETEYKKYDYTSQINLPISCAREEEHPYEIQKQITPNTRSLANGTLASQMKLFLDDASSIAGLPGSLQRILPNNTPLKDKQVERYLLPSAISDQVARENPQIRYIYEERGKKHNDGDKNYNQFHISIQCQPNYVAAAYEKESNPLAYKKNISTLRIY